MYKIACECLRNAFRHAQAGAPGTTACRASMNAPNWWGGKLSVWSQLNSGTVIELTIPAAIAYTKIQGAMKLGAKAYLLKTQLDKELLGTITGRTSRE